VRFRTKGKISEYKVLYKLNILLLLSFLGCKDLGFWGQDFLHEAG
jgi:hypothetical protein